MNMNLGYFFFFLSCLQIFATFATFGMEWEKHNQVWSRGATNWMGEMREMDEWTNDWMNEGILVLVVVGFLQLMKNEEEEEEEAIRLAELRMRYFSFGSVFRIADSIATTAKPITALGSLLSAPVE